MAIVEAEETATKESKEAKAEAKTTIIRLFFHEKKSVSLSFEDITYNMSNEEGLLVLYGLEWLIKDKQVEIIKGKFWLTERGAIMLLQDIYKFNYIVSAELLLRLIKSPFSPLEWRKIKTDIRFLPCKFGILRTVPKKTMKNATTELVKRGIVNDNGEFIINVEDLKYLALSIHTFT